MSSEPSTIPSAGRKSRLQRILFVTLGISGFVLLVLLATRMFGHRIGTEFCPQTFARRTFSYYELPLLGLQVSGLRHDPITNQLERYLSNKRLVSPVATDPQRWDLVAAGSSGVPTFHGDAHILCEYLDAKDSDDNFVWEQWSSTHPERAKVLWPQVADVARQQLYLLVPDLMSLAMEDMPAAELDQRLKDTLAKKYGELAGIQQQLGAHAAAIELLDQALVYAVEDEQRKRLREECEASISAEMTSSSGHSAAAEGS